MERVIEMLGGVKTVPIDTVVGKARRKISAAGRKRIAAAQRARWAKLEKRRRRRSKGASEDELLQSQNL